MFKARKILKDIHGFQQEADVWRRLLVSNSERLEAGRVDFLSRELVVDGEPSGFSAGYALDRLFVCAVRLRDLEHMARSFWPHRNSLSPVLGQPNGQGQTWAELEQFLRGFASTEINYRLIHREYLEHALGNDQVVSSPDRLNVIDAMAALRRFVGKASLVGGDFSGLYALLQDPWRDLLQAAIDQLSHEDLQRLRESVKRYLSRHGLFPWLVGEHYGDGMVSALLELAFDLARLTRWGDRMQMDRDLKDILSDFDADDELKSEVASVVGRLSAVVRQIGSLDHLYDSLVDEGGQWGRDSMVGSSGRINVVPVREGAAGQCQEILVAIARGAKRRHVGLKDVLRQVRAHLVKCGDSRCPPNGPTRAVILITDTWDPGIISESTEDFRAHGSSAVPKIFVGMLVNGPQVTPQALF